MPSKCTQTHFATEENLMREHAYDHASSHQTEHPNLVKRVTDFKSQFDAGTVALAIPVPNFLGD